MDETYLPPETATAASAVSWSAIFAGAAAAVAASLTLFALAAGLDLVSPEPLGGTAAATTAMLAALALVVTQWISAALGGYLSGRLRTRWPGTSAHEASFRDGAHGFITWCVATVFMASGLVAALSAVVGTRSHAGGAAAYGRPAIRVSSESADSLATADAVTFNPVTATAVSPAYGELVLPDGPGSAAAVETHRAALAGPRTQEQLAQWQLRELRVPAAAPRDEQKNAAAGSMLTALSLVIGALIASLSAVLGGRQRDHHPWRSHP